jgi:hypothetical protein
MCNSGDTGPARRDCSEAEAVYENANHLGNWILLCLTEVKLGKTYQFYSGPK